MRTKPWIFFLLLLSVLLIQYSDAIGLFQDRWNRKLYPNRTFNAGERGADYIAGYEYYRYIEFLQENIPEEGRVVIVGQGPNAYYSHRTIVSFLVFPREIRDCAAIQDCDGLLNDGEVFIISLSPMSDLPVENREALYHSESIVLFLPENN